MRELTTTTSLEEARRLVAYLAVQAVESRMDDDDGEWTIWILNDDDRDKAVGILQDFEQNPEDPKFENAERKVRSVLHEAERLAKQSNRANKLRKRWGGSWWHSYPATCILIGLCVFVSVVCTNWMAMETSQFGLPALCNNNNSWLLEKLGVAVPARIKETPDGRELYYYVVPELPGDLTDISAVWESLKGKAAIGWMTFSATMASGELWRPITPIFIHLGVAHILFNMMWLNSMGRAIEYVRGTKRFLVLCLILAVTSCLAQLFWAGPAFGGMSGVVFGLIGYVWMKGKTQPHLGIGLEQQTVVYSFLWLFLCMSGAMGAIANAAHLMGFVVGIAIGARQAIWKKLPFGK